MLGQGEIYAAGQLLNAAFRHDVHEIDFRLVEEEMIVQGGDVDSILEEHAHHRVHFILEQHEVAGDHRFGLLALHERGPRRQAHERRHPPPVHRNRQVATRRGDFKHALCGVERAFEAGELFELVGIQRGVRREWQRNRCNEI